ncbi:MAG: hypothetical protein Q8M19_18880 [Reyranella sp.]|nr:hypothetical protein [Reyranella sp.]
MTTLLLAACDLPSQWEKPGVERAALDSDVLQCRHAGQQESLRAYASQINFPFYSAPFWGGSWQPTRDLWNRSVEADRARAETSFTADCMRGKGYSKSSGRSSIAAP